MKTPWITYRPARSSAVPKNHAVDWVDIEGSHLCVTRCGLFIPNCGMELNRIGLPKYHNCKRCQRFVLGDLGDLEAQP